MKNRPTWDEYADRVDLLASKITKKYTAIYGVPRGGLIPAVMLSHRLGIKLITSEAMVKMMKPKEVLIVDDLTDSGSTLSAFSKYDTAVVYHNSESKSVPTYYADTKPEGWVKFPYEYVR